MSSLAIISQLEQVLGGVKIEFILSGLVLVISIVLYLLIHRSSTPIPPSSSREEVSDISTGLKNEMKHSNQGSVDDSKVSLSYLLSVVVMSGPWPRQEPPSRDYQAIPCRYNIKGCILIICNVGIKSCSFP